MFEPMRQGAMADDSISHCRVDVIVGEVTVGLKVAFCVRAAQQYELESHHRFFLGRN
jgi:hypothetical protein